MLLPHRSRSNGANNCDVRRFMVPPPKTIAVVDDDPDVLKAIGRLFAVHGFYSEVFASAETFLNRNWAREPACLVLDVHLASMSGIDLQRRLKASGSQLPIIFRSKTRPCAGRRWTQAALRICISRVRPPC